MVRQNSFHTEDVDLSGLFATIVSTCSGLPEPSPCDVTCHMLLNRPCTDNLLCTPSQPRFGATTHLPTRSRISWWTFTPTYHWSESKLFLTVLRVFPWPLQNDIGIYSRGGDYKRHWCNWEHSWVTSGSISISSLINSLSWHSSIAHLQRARKFLSIDMSLASYLQRILTSPPDGGHRPSNGKAGCLSAYLYI